MGRDVECLVRLRRRADRAHVLNIYAWAEYFPPSVVAKFEAESGIHVNYAVLDSPEMAETILSVGNSNYDLVTMNAAPEMGREIPKGFWKVLDRSRIPNVRNADPRIMQLLSSRRSRQSACGAVDVGHHRSDLRSGQDQIDHAERADRQPRHDLQEGAGRQVRALRDRHHRLVGRHHAHGGALSGATRAVIGSRAARRRGGQAAGDQTVSAREFPPPATTSSWRKGICAWPSAIPAMP